MTNNKATHGGSRKGSGKKKGFTKQHSVWCHPEAICIVRQFAKSESEKIINSKKE